jgi:hypothetical protein
MPSSSSTASAEELLCFFFPPIPANNSLAVYLSAPGFHLSLSLYTNVLELSSSVDSFFLYFFTLAELSASQTVWTISRPADKRSPGNARRHKGLSIPISHRKQTLSLWLYKGKSKLDIIYCRRREREGETTSGRYDDAGPGQTQHASPSTALVAWRLILQLAY